ncbi:MAG: TonB family protein [Saprospiraceae bacterium]|nr:TonB family protein [Saprospiraceae bacterium]
MSWNGYPAWDENRSIYFNFGMVCSLFIVIWIVNISIVRPEFDQHYDLEDGIMHFNSFTVEEHVSKVSQRVKKVIKTAVPVIAEIKESNKPVTDEITLNAETNENLASEETVAIESTKMSEFTAELPVVTKPQSVYSITEEMPFLYECGDIQNESQRRECTQTALLKYLYANLKYPDIARQEGLEGNVVISFIISKDGRLINPVILKEIGGGCGDAVLSVITKLTTWQPGKQNHKAVDVKYTIPVAFKLMH